MMKLFPVKLEIYEDHDMIASVEVFDSDCVTISISSPMTLESFDETSSLIRQAIIMCDLENQPT